MEENKFNFSEEETQQMKDEAVETSKENVKKDAQGLWKSFKNYFHELLDFRHDTDRDNTIAAIKADIEIKGATSWILICSIFVASVGLNANSTAVVIGAMLISPLMGPILGVGLGIAINDIDTLRKSLINLASMLVLSLLTAFLFFYLFPLREDTSELLGRVKPDIRDVLIAFFGGLALIIARTKKGTIASVIFGVAIATALMPPLCTAGYGLAKALRGDFWKGLEYAGGAMYLFTINTIFIALATFIIIKYLRFPMLKYANSKKRKRIARLASLLAILVMAPTIFIFINVIKENTFNVQAKAFLESEIKSNPYLQLMYEDYDYDSKTIELSFFNEIVDATRADLEHELNSNPDYSSLKDVKLFIKGSDTKSYELITSAYKDVKYELKEKKNIIRGLQKEIEELKTHNLELTQALEKKNNSQAVGFSNISKDAKIAFQELRYFSYAKVPESKTFSRVDSIHLARVQWVKTMNDTMVAIKNTELNKWLKEQLKVDNVVLENVSNQ